MLSLESNSITNSLDGYVIPLGDTFVVLLNIKCI